MKLTHLSPVQYWFIQILCKSKIGEMLGKLKLIKVVIKLRELSEAKQMLLIKMVDYKI